MKHCSDCKYGLNVHSKLLLPKWICQKGHDCEVQEYRSFFMKKDCKDYKPKEGN